MEAKDTVSYECICSGFEEHTLDCCCYNSGREKQAEISFKAGIKEVVDFVKEGGYLMGDNWQAKLQEWGIKEAK